MGEEKKKGGVDPDALTEFLKNEGIVDQLKDSETGDDDTTKSQNNIEIDPSGDNIIIKVLNSEGEEKPPSEVEIDGEVDKDNLLTYKVSVDGSGTTTKTVNDSVTSIDKSNWSEGLDKKDINNVSGEGSVTGLTATITSQKIKLEEYQTQVSGGTSGNVSATLIKIKELEKDIKKNAKLLKDAEKDTNKVKVVAFFTKNKSGRKQTVEFTYDGSTLKL